MPRVVKWLLALVGGLMLFLAVTKIVHWTWNHERAGRSISGWASHSLAGAFTFGRVDYPWLGAVASLVGGPPVRFDAWNVHIRDPDGDEVLYADHVQAGLRLHRLIGGRLAGALLGVANVQLHFVDGVVDHVRCKIAVGDDGKVNLVAAFATVKPAPSHRPRGGMVVSLAGSVIHDGRFSMSFPDWKTDIEHFVVNNDSLRYSSFHSEQRADSPAFTYRVSRLDAPTGSLTIGKFSFPLQQLSASEFRAEEPRRQDMVLKGSAHSHGAVIVAAGRFTDLYTADRGVELELDGNHGAGVLAALPSRHLLSGDASATAHLSGRFGALVIDGRAAEAELRTAGLVIQHLDARYRLTPGALQLDNVTADVAGGHARGNAHFDWKTRSWRADVDVEGIRTLQLGPLAPLEVLAYIAGIPILIGRAGKNGDSTEHLHVEGVDVTLYRRARELLPHRVQLQGALDR